MTDPQQNDENTEGQQDELTDQERDTPPETPVQPDQPPHPDAANPHPFEEDPEEHLGDEIPDPWTDPSQEDWPNNDETDEETA